MTETYWQWFKTAMQQIPSKIRNFFGSEQTKFLGFTAYGFSGYVIFILSLFTHPLVLLLLVPWLFGLTYIYFWVFKRDC